MSAVMGTHILAFMLNVLLMIQMCEVCLREGASGIMDEIVMCKKVKCKAHLSNVVGSQLLCQQRLKWKLQQLHCRTMMCCKMTFKAEIQHQRDHK